MPHPQFAGLPQVNIEPPNTLKDCGRVETIVLANRWRTNAVELNFGNQ